MLLLPTRSNITRSVFGGHAFTHIATVALAFSIVLAFSGATNGTTQIVPRPTALFFILLLVAVSMFGRTEDNKILRSVIGAIFVPVVNMLSFIKHPAKKFGHYKAVFANVAALIRHRVLMPMQINIPLMFDTPTFPPATRRTTLPFVVGWLASASNTTTNTRTEHAAYNAGRSTPNGCAANNAMVFSLHRLSIPQTATTINT